MKNLKEWIEKKINDGDINYIDYNEFKILKEISEENLIKKSWEHRGIGVVTLKILRKDSIMFKSDNYEIFSTKV